MEVEIEYKNGFKEWGLVDDNLEVIRIDTFIFIYDYSIESVLVYTGEDDLECIDEFESKEFNAERCLAYIKEYILVNY